MNKFQIVSILKRNGDSIISLKGEDPIGVTTDFSDEWTKYFKRNRFNRYSIMKDCILVFSWTDDAFRNIPIDSIKAIKPLSEILNNG